MPQIFVVTDRHQTNGRTLISVLEKVVQAEADAIILREKDLPPAELYKLACQVQTLCAGSKTKLLINSSVETALACGSHGVHLGFCSLPIEPARRVMPEKIVGISVHSTAEALAAQNDGANYVVAGHVFATDSKPGQPGRGLAFITQVSSQVEVPVIAIGGISPANAASVIKAGANGIAVLSTVMQSADIPQTIRTLRQAII